MTPHPQYVAFYKYIENDTRQNVIVFVPVCWF